MNTPVSKADLHPTAPPTMRCRHLDCWECGSRPVRDVARRLCRSCYERARRRGVLPPRDFSLALERLTTSDGECLIWLGAINEHGYGTWKGKYAHRLNYERVHGVIPDRRQLDHLCRNPACLRVDHLEAVTHKVNSERVAVLITHCIHGHEFTPENTYWRPGSRPGLRRRDCRKCQQIRDERRVR